MRWRTRTVSKLGNSIPSRLCGAIVTALGFGDWVAEDEAEYLRIALEKAQDLQALARFRRASRSRIAASPAGNPALYTGRVEQAYAEMWQRLLLRCHG